MARLPRALTTCCYSDRAPVWVRAIPIGTDGALGSLDISASSVLREPFGGFFVNPFSCFRFRLEIIMWVCAPWGSVTRTNHPAPASSAAPARISREVYPLSQYVGTDVQSRSGEISLASWPLASGRAITLSDLQAPFSHVVCKPCGRRGRYAGPLFGRARARTWAASASWNVAESDDDEFDARTGQQPSQVDRKLMMAAFAGRLARPARSQARTGRLRDDCETRHEDADDRRSPKNCRRRPPAGDSLGDSSASFSTQCKPARLSHGGNGTSPAPRRLSSSVAERRILWS